MYNILFNIGLKFHPEKEVMVETRRHTGKGRMDSRIGAIVIEYKHRSKLESQQNISSAINQIEEYIISISNKNSNETIGFLTDGLSLYEIRANNGVIFSRSGKSEINEQNLKKIVEIIISLERSALTSENLIRDFCGEYNQGVLFEVARICNEILTTRSTPKTKMLQSEWEELFRLAHEDQSQQKRIQDRRKILSDIFERKFEDASSEYQALFALHTAYAIVLKTMAFRVVSDLKFDSPMIKYRDLIGADSQGLRSFYSDLEDGEIFRKIGILNLLEGDFFLWYSDKGQWNQELSDSIKNVIEILARYEDISKIFSQIGAIDLFRELYEATVPQVVRASFGEVYTPLWLAQHVLRSSILNENWRMLDPCGGSGTFIIAAISQIRKDENNMRSKQEMLDQILKRVVAIDLNPLSVLTMRINYFIHISDLLPDDVSNLVIPVYLGDSSYLPEKVNITGIYCLKYKLNTLKSPISIELPVSLVEDTPTFVQLMYKYERLIKNKDSKSASKLLIESLDEDEKREDIKEKINNLTDQLVGLEEKKWNGIWARIITNFLITACLGHFSNVVGNPPWIDWKNLPAGYREKVKSICIERKLFSGAGRTGGINLNICALIAHVAATNWLDDSGRLAFLMPKELAYQASYEGWRQSVGGENRTILEFHDWSKAGHPFNSVKEDFLTYIIGEKKIKISDLFNIIQTTQYIKKRGRRPKAHEWDDIDEAMENLNIVLNVAGQIIPNSTAYTFAKDEQRLRDFSEISGECAYVGREGIEFFPQELLLFTYVKSRQDRKEVILKNKQMNKSKYKVPSQKVVLETKFLYPLVKGPEIERFRHNYSGLITPFPYEKSIPNKPIDINLLEIQSPMLLSYYKKFQPIIEEQTAFSDKIRGPDAGEFYGLARTGPYSFQEVYVAFRDNSKWRAAVITSTKMPWGERRRFVFQNHAASMCERKDKSGYINEDEAHYICAILNAPIVEEFIYASSDNRSFKIRPPIFIPKFDTNNEKHMKLVELSKEAHESTDIYIYLEKINEIYLELCKERRSP